MLHEPFGPRGAEDEREDFWTDLGEITDAAFRQDPGENARRLGTQNALHGPEYRPDTVQDVPTGPQEQPGAGTASRQDPLGSWTGVPAQETYDTPTQDADDL